MRCNLAKDCDSSASRARSWPPLGLLILREFNRGVTFPLGYSNGCQIYLTTDAMLPEGGYEVDSYWEYHWPAPLAPGGEKVLEDALRQLRDCGGILNE